MDSTRRRILQIHGIALIVVGLANVVLSTVGAFWGIGMMGFLQVQRIGHVGLIQAYLLAALFGVVLLIGARQPVPIIWDGIGLLVHLSILVAYVLYWDFFPAVAPGFEAVRYAALFHISFAALETWAIVGRPFAGTAHRLSAL
jgi:hypothetical protein